MNLFTLDFLGDPTKIYPFLPTVVDGVVLPKMPIEMLAEKNFNPVPYIIGINKQEFGWILPLFMGLHSLQARWTRNGHVTRVEVLPHS